MGQTVPREPGGPAGFGPPATVQVRYKLKRLASQVRAVRGALARLAEERLFGAQAVRELTLALGEALDNALEHGCPSGGSVVVVLAAGPDTVRVTVEDPGGGGPPLDAAGYSSGAGEGRTADASRGRGLYLIRRVMDRVDVTPLPEGGTRIVMIKKR